MFTSALSLKSITMIERRSRTWRVRDTTLTSIDKFHSRFVNELSFIARSHVASTTCSGCMSRTSVKHGRLVDEEQLTESVFINSVWNVISHLLMQLLYDKNGGWRDARDVHKLSETTSLIEHDSVAFWLSTPYHHKFLACTTFCDVKKDFCRFDLPRIVWVFWELRVVVVQTMRMDLVALNI